VVVVVGQALLQQAAEGMVGMEPGTVVAAVEVEQLKVAAMAAMAATPLLELLLLQPTSNHAIRYC
jgi:hypothetical protein